MPDAHMMQDSSADKLALCSYWHSDSLQIRSYSNSYPIYVCSNGTELKSSGAVIHLRELRPCSLVDIINICVKDTAFAFSKEKAGLTAPKASRQSDSPPLALHEHRQNL
jgi:hypothetical protein